MGEGVKCCLPQSPHPHRGENKYFVIFATIDNVSTKADKYEFNLERTDSQDVCVFL